MAPTRRRPQVQAPSTGDQLKGAAVDQVVNYGTNKAVDYGLNAASNALGFTKPLASALPGQAPSLVPGLGAESLFNSPSLIPELGSSASSGGSALGAAAGLGSSAPGYMTLATQGMPIANPFGTAGNTLGAIGGVAGAYSLIDNWGKNTPLGGAAAGAGIGSAIFPGVGTLVGAGLGALLGTAKAGKHKDQKSRDAVRASMKERGFIDDKYKLGLADGTQYDIGIDGGSQPYNVDFNRQGIGDVVGLANPLAEIMTGGNDKLRSQFAGYFTNAATSSGDSSANIKGMYEKAGLNADTASQAIDQLLAQEKVTPEEAAAYKNGIKTLYGLNKPEPTKSSRKDGGSRRKKPREEWYDGAENAVAPVTNVAPQQFSNYDDIARAYANVYASNQRAPVPNPLVR